MAKDNIIECIGSKLNTCDYSSTFPTATIGNSVFMDNGLCYEIIDSSQPGAPNPLSLYVNCVECMSNNRGYVRFNINCKGTLGSPTFIIFISDLGFIPNENEIYYFTLSQIGGPYQGVFTSCFLVEKVGYLTEDGYNNIVLNQENANLITSPILQTDCQTCELNNYLTYSVNRCDDGAVFYIQLPPGLEEHLISFESGVDQFCGIVKSLNNESVNASFISDFGVSEGKDCNICLDVVNQKLLLENCNDPLIQEVVWASSLYNQGEISSLSTSEGCFTVVGLTESAVTVTSFFDFAPNPDCTSCAECDGFFYDFRECNGGYTPQHNFNSYQLLSVGEFVYNPILGVCGYIYAVYPIDPLTIRYLPSVRSFGTGGTSCESCTATTQNFDVYSANICFYEYLSGITEIYLSAESGLNIGDVVKIKIANNEFLCVSITSDGIGGALNIYDVVTDNSGNTITYNDCQTCQDNSYIGITLSNCNSNVTKFVSMKLSDWLIVSGVYLPFEGSLLYPQSTVKLSDGQCYSISSEICIIPLSSTTETVVVMDYYVFCGSCIPDNSDFPRSAGTESFICVICNDIVSGETATSVSPPHPVWTDSRGTAVTQLNAIALGGMNGLNS